MRVSVFSRSLTGPLPGETGAGEDEEEEEEEEEVEEVEEGGEEVEGWEEETGTFSGATVVELVGVWSFLDMFGPPPTPGGEPKIPSALAISGVCSTGSHDCCKPSNWSAG